MVLRRSWTILPEGLGWLGTPAAETATTKPGSPRWQDMLFHKGDLIPRFSLWESQRALDYFQTKAFSVTGGS